MRTKTLAEAKKHAATVAAPLEARVLALESEVAALKKRLAKPAKEKPVAPVAEPVPTVSSEASSAS